MNDLKTEEQNLEYLYAQADKMPAIYRPSKFWSDENKRHRAKLMEADLSNFKRSINVRYFNWRTLGIIRHQMQPIIKGMLAGNFAPLFRSKLVRPRLSTIKSITNFNPLAALVYQTYVAYLYEFVKQGDRLGLLESIPEPSFGNPFLVNYKGVLISQDLCNSIHEFYSVMNHASFERDNLNIGELGAGYGRTAYVFLKALPKASYCIIDIPPALYVSQEYLSKVFPNEKIFHYRPWTNFESIKNEFNSARIKFLLPSQIELLPPKFFDLFINISSLHEMSTEQIANYTGQIDRVCSGYFYTKQWRRSRVRDNNHIRMDYYPKPAEWQEIYKHSRHPIQRMFFDALYKMVRNGP